VKLILAIFWFYSGSLNLLNILIHGVFSLHVIHYLIIYHIKLFGAINILGKYIA